jgi:hypothetical protein
MLGSCPAAQSVSYGIGAELPSRPSDHLLIAVRAASGLKSLEMIFLHKLRRQLLWIDTLVKKRVGVGVFQQYFKICLETREAHEH